MTVDLILLKGKGLILKNPKEFDDYFSKEDKEEIIYNSGFVHYDNMASFYFFSCKCTELNTEEYNTSLADQSVHDDFKSFALPLKQYKDKQEYVTKLIKKIKKSSKISAESLKKLHALLESDYTSYNKWLVALWS